MAGTSVNALSRSVVTCSATPEVSVVVPEKVTFALPSTGTSPTAPCASSSACACIPDVSVVVFVTFTFADASCSIGSVSVSSAACSVADCMPDVSTVTSSDGIVTDAPACTSIPFAASVPDSMPRAASI